MELIACYTHLNGEIADLEEHILELERLIDETDKREASKPSREGIHRKLSSSKQLIDNVYAAATYDGVTGLKTRKYFNEICKEFESKNELSCLLSDIDYFGRYNNAYGHPQGDYALRIVADVMKNHGGSEYVFRYGGEEYLLFLVDRTYTSQQLFAIADRIRKEVEEMTVPTIDDRQEIEKQEQKYPRDVHHVTISIGGAIRQQDESLEHLIYRADRALYAAKAAGRNTVKISE